MKSVGSLGESQRCCEEWGVLELLFKKFLFENLWLKKFSI